jgi:MFS family permease
MIFLLGRIIAGGAGAGSGVVQAAMNDISLPEERTKNMGLIGAMFGIGFLI